jgi:sulfite exporter TauE/SafE
MNRILYVLGIIIATLALGLTGAYVLWQFHTTVGLGTGVVLIVLAIAVALPAQLKKGAQDLKGVSVDLHDATVVVLPAVEDALRGGDRHTDPPVKS